MAGHLCLDLFPPLGPTALDPGVLVETGPMVASSGGCVANVGTGLRILGSEVRMVGAFGEDPLGRWLSSLLPGVERLPIAGTTSYSVVLSAPGRDRTFLHHPGLNAAFDPDLFPRRLLEGARWLHFGYPPLMRTVFADGGVALARLFADARAAGVGTSLDLSLPDPASESGRVDWRSFLTRVLPVVDLFAPSEEELAFTLGVVDPLSLGCGAVLLKRGANGASYRSSREAHEVPAAEVDVVGTTGAGDGTVAGFLHASLTGASARDALAFAVRCGGAACTAEDATSGLRSLQA